MTPSTNLHASTLDLIQQALIMGEDMIKIIEKFKHSRTLMKKFHHIIDLTQQVLRDFNTQYTQHTVFFEMNHFNIAFQNFNQVLLICLKFLTKFKSKSLLYRLIKGDKYYKICQRLIVDIDQALGLLCLGFKMKNLTELQVQQNSDRLYQSRLEFEALEPNGFNDFTDHTVRRVDSATSSSDEDREKLIQEINEVKNDIASTLGAVEISRRLLKENDTYPPRVGKNFKVYKREYKGEEVAEKVFVDRVGAGKILEQVKKQVAILTKLSICPNIIKFYGVCIRNSHVGLVTEYCELGNLRDYLEAYQLNNQQKYQFCFDLIQGVTFLHYVDIIHKNIKTSSLLINNDGHLKLSGFEFSREQDYGTCVIDDEGLDRYRWLCPEKIKGTSLSTTSGDIYSTGMVFWSIWTQRYPFKELYKTNVEYFVLKGGRENLDFVPKRVSPIIASCWDQDPDRRPNASEVLDAFENFGSGKSLNTLSLNYVQQKTYGSNIIDELATTQLSVVEEKRQSNEGTSFYVPAAPKETTDGSPKMYCRVPATAPTEPPAAAPIASPTAEDLDQDSQLEELYDMLTNLKSFPRPATHQYKQSDPDVSTDMALKSQNTSTTSFDSRPLSAKWNGDTEIYSSQGMLKHTRAPSIPVVAKLNEKITLSSPIFNHNQHDIYESQIALLDETDLDIDLMSSSPNSPTLPPPLSLSQAIELHIKGARAEALEAFDTLSQMGDPKAEYYMGYYYFWGQPDVVTKDWEKSVYYLNKAAEKGDSDAYDLLGMYFASEDNELRDLEKAVDYYVQSAQMGNKKGLYHLGVCYAKGRGVETDKSLALKCIEEAAKLGHTLAKEQLQRIKSN
jgi:serine/threonine protein kinase